MNGPVICGVDDSSATGAVEVARDLAERHELPLVYAHVLDRGEEHDAAEERLHTAAGRGDCEVVIDHGHPADRLVTLARERHASFLVLGNHGPRSSLLGSISADVARRAPCPVVVVPTTVEAPRAQAASNGDFAGGIVRFGLGRARGRRSLDVGEDA